MSEPTYTFHEFCGERWIGDGRPHICPKKSALCLAGHHDWNVVRLPASGPRTFKCARCLIERLEPMPDGLSISPALREQMDREGDARSVGDRRGVIEFGPQVYTGPCEATSICPALKSRRCRALSGHSGPHEWLHINWEFVGSYPCTHHVWFQFW